MIEYTTYGIVLTHEPQSERNGRITLYTKEYGKITGTAYSIRAITSKLAGHLQPLHLSHVRIVTQHHTRIVDAVRVGRFPRSSAALRLVDFVAAMTPEHQPDPELWDLLITALQKPDTIAYADFLITLGFSPEYARCARCGSSDIAGFTYRDHCFLCHTCVREADAATLVPITR